MSDDELLSSCRCAPPSDSDLYEFFWIRVSDIRNAGRLHEIIPLSFDTAKRKLDEFRLWSDPDSPYYSPRCRIVSTNQGLKLYANAHDFKLRKDDCLPIPNDYLEDVESPNGHFVMDFVETRECLHYSMPEDLINLTPDQYSLFVTTYPEFLQIHNYRITIPPHSIYESARKGSETLRYLRILRPIDDIAVTVAGRGIAPFRFDPAEVTACDLLDLHDLREFLLYAWEHSAGISDDMLIRQRIAPMIDLCTSLNRVEGQCAPSYDHLNFSHNCLVDRAYRR